MSDANERGPDRRDLSTGDSPNTIPATLAEVQWRSGSRSYPYADQCLSAHVNGYLIDAVADDQYHQDGPKTVYSWRCVGGGDLSLGDPDVTGEADSLEDAQSRAFAFAQSLPEGASGDTSKTLPSGQTAKVVAGMMILAWEGEQPGVGHAFLEDGSTLRVDNVLDEDAADRAFSAAAWIAYKDTYFETGRVLRAEGTPGTPEYEALQEKNGKEREERNRKRNKEREARRVTHEGAFMSNGYRVTVRELASGFSWFALYATDENDRVPDGSCKSLEEAVADSNAALAGLPMGAVEGEWRNIGGTCITRLFAGVPAVVYGHESNATVCIGLHDTLYAEDLSCGGVDAMQLARDMAGHVARAHPHLASPTDWETGEAAWGDVPAGAAAEAPEGGAK